MRPQYELDLIDGMHNNERVDDLSVLDGWYSCIIGSKQLVDCPFKILYVISKILKLILAFTGSQCRLFKIGVIWSVLHVPVIIRAAIFWILCNLPL